MSEPWKTWVKVALLVGTLVGLGLFLETTHFNELLNKAWIDETVRGHGIHGVALFLGLGALITAMGLPRQAVAFMGGYAFGFLSGMFWALAATLGGCILSFFWARGLGRSLVRRAFKRRIQRFDEFIHDHPFSTSLLLRLMPVTNNLGNNLVAGVSSISPPIFFGASLIGYIPQTLVFTLVGSGVHVDPTLRFSLAALVFLGSSTLGILLFRRYRKARRLQKALAAETENGT